MRIDRANVANAFTAWMTLAAAILCGGSRANAATFTIGGTLSGLKAAESVTLFDNGGNALKVMANGTFTFKTGLATGAAYKVTVDLQPAGQVCAVTAGAGKVASANVKSVIVKCANAYKIGGTLSGLTAKESIVLADNGLSPLTLKANGSFAFATPLIAGAAYKVTVKTQPAGEMCTVTKGAGKVAAANVTTVAVACAKVYSIGGTVTGLTTGKFVTLEDNLASPLKVSLNGKFTFATKLPAKAKYSVKVSVQPVGETCTVADGAGSVVAANITNVAVSCKANTVATYSIGGNVTGLTTGAKVILLNNSTNALTVSANASFAFTTRLATGKTFDVTVGTQPAGETCTVTKGTGTVAAANITTVAVACKASSAATFTIGGNVTGLTSGAKVGLSDNANDPLTVTGTSASSVAFKFAKALATGASYSVSITSQPTGETCVITGSTGSGKVSTANVTTVGVSCSPSSTGGTGFWLPYFESPANGATDGLNGLLVLPTGNLSSSPKPTTITTQPASSLGYAVDYNVSGGNPTFMPAFTIYIAPDNSGNQHIYSLSLAASATAPVSKQISNLSVPPANAICNAQVAQTDLGDATTTFILVDTAAPADSCGTDTDTFEVIHIGDASTKAPSPVTVPNTSFDTLYSNGTLSGLLFYDFSGGGLVLYADDTFTSPKTVLSSISDDNDLNVGALVKLSSLESEGIYTVTTDTTGLINTLYHVDNTGKATKILQGGNFDSTGVGDDNNIYFLNYTTASNITTAAIYQLALNGTTPTKLYSKALTASEQLALVGSNDSVLVFQDESLGSTPTGKFMSIPVGKSSSTATLLGGPYTGITQGILATGSTGAISEPVLFVSIANSTLVNDTPVFNRSSVALQLDGSSSATKPTANSFYGAFGAAGDLLTGGAFQVTGITATDGSLGGGTLYQTDVSTLTNTLVTTTGGGGYKIPAGFSLGLEAISSNGINLGELFNMDESTISSTNPGFGSMGAAFDQTRSFLLPVAVTDTDVDPF